ncbi:hypothetical protein FHG87_021532 [Trinorchestia longiramus]|nr:hypothetical protein FHG87_021532 [Trinorchestia longiramus]
MHKTSLPLPLHSLLEDPPLYPSSSLVGNQSPTSDEGNSVGGEPPNAPRPSLSDPTGLWEQGCSHVTGGAYDRLNYCRPVVTETPPHYYKIPTTLPIVPTTPLPPSTTLTRLQPRNLPTIPTITTTTTIITTPTTTFPTSTTIPSSTIPLPQQHPTSATTTHLQPTTSTNLIASTGLSPTSTNSAVGTIFPKTTTTFSQPLPITTTPPITNTTTTNNSNNSTTSPPQEVRISLTPSTDSNNENSTTPPPLPGNHPLSPNFNFNKPRSKSSGVKVSNLQPDACNDTYSTPKLNNLDLSLEGSDPGLKIGAFSNLDVDGNNFNAGNLFSPARHPRSPDDNDSDNDSLLSAITDGDHSSDGETDAINVHTT